MKSKEAIPDEDVEEMLSGGQVLNTNSKGVYQEIVFFKGFFLFRPE